MRFKFSDPSNSVIPPPESALFVPPLSSAVGRLPATVDGANADSNASSSGIDSGFSDSCGGSDSPPPAAAVQEAAKESKSPTSEPGSDCHVGKEGFAGNPAPLPPPPPPPTSSTPQQESCVAPRESLSSAAAVAQAAVAVRGAGAPPPPLGAVSATGATAADHDEDALSDVSEISGLSGANWKPEAGPFSWVQSQMMQGRDPRLVLQNMLSSDIDIPDNLDQMTLWRIILNLMTEPERRKKLEHVNTIEDVVGLIAKSKNIIVLTGAGVSVSCGIPDFRSKDGVYARLAVDFPDLPDPQAMFDIQYFRK